MTLNFKMSELLESEKAKIYKIDNIPDKEAMNNLLNLIYYCLQPIRDKLKKPVIIINGFRNYTLNKLIGGAENSQHLKGQAADIAVKGMTIQELFNFIRTACIPFDQLIWEQDSNCCHISYNHDKNRKEVLIRDKNGKYKKI